MFNQYKQEVCKDQPNHEALAKAKEALNCSGISGLAGQDEYDMNRLQSVLTNLKVYADFYGLAWDYAVSYAHWHAKFERIPKGEDDEARQYD